MENINPERQRGFTLIELMIVVSCLSILVTPFIYLEVKFSEKFQAGIVRRDKAEEGATTLDWIANDIKSASSILDKWREQPFSSSCLVLVSGEGSAVVYSFDPARKIITRTEYNAFQEGAKPAAMEIAHDVESFNIDPADPKAATFNVSIEFSRSLIESTVRVSMSRSASRRIK